MLKNSGDKTRFSRPITRIAVASIALGICVMILSVSVVRGFQNEIRDKVIGFGSHIQINHRTTNNSFESVPVDIDTNLMEEIAAQEGVKHVQPYAIKPAIIQVRRKTEDTTRVNDNEILGVICKGVNSQFDWTFFQNNLKDGSVLDLSKKTDKNEIVLSKGVSEKLKVKVGDSLYLFMVVADGPKPNKFYVKGIYETGLSDFDDQFVFIDIKHIQKINDWGIEAFVKIGERTSSDFTIHTIVTGANEKRFYRWNGVNRSAQDSIILPLNDTTIELVVTDNTWNADKREYIQNFKGDTVNIGIHYKKIGTLTDTINDYPIVTTVNDSTTLYQYLNDRIYLIQKNSGGSYQYTAGGYEVLLNEWKDLFKADEILTDVIPYDFETKPITKIYTEIFDWLELLDTNVEIIILLMLLICLINMSSTLLVIILERTTMIGTMKAIGSSNRSISKIFIYNASWYIIRGLIIGNILAIGLGILQQQTGFIKMNQETYFMATVPVHLDIWYILAIDLGTLVICTLAMLLPSMIISKISPVKAIRFK